MTIIKLTNAQCIALDDYLSYYPDNLSYSEIIARLKIDDMIREDEDENIDEDKSIFPVWHLEDLWGEHLAILIEKLHDELVEIYGEYEGANK